MARVVASAALSTALLASRTNANASNYFVMAEAPDYNNKAVANLLANVNSVRKPGEAYAVFDWDHSSMFGDMSATTMFYQVDNLNFRFSPKEFESIFSLGYNASSSDTCFPNGTHSVIGQDVNGADVTFLTVLTDSAEDYKVLYDAYIAPTYNLTCDSVASAPLDDIKESAGFLNFRAKLGFLLSSLQMMNGGDDHSECSLINGMIVYPRLFVGMTEDEIKTLARASIRWNLAESLESLTYTSTGDVAVKSSYSKGLRVFGGQAAIMRVFREAGVAVYVLSGSPELLVAEAADFVGLGYLVARDYVYGGRFTTDAAEVFTGELVDNYPTTWGPGKATVITSILAQNHNGTAPIYSRTGTVRRSGLCATALFTSITASKTTRRASTASTRRPASTLARQSPPRTTCTCCRAKTSPSALGSPRASPPRMVSSTHLACQPTTDAPPTNFLTFRRLRGHTSRTTVTNTFDVVKKRFQSGSRPSKRWGRNID